MSGWILAAAIIGPALFWGGYLYYKDAFRREPVVNLLEGFGLGFLAGFLCWLFYEALTGLGLPINFQAALLGRTPVEFLLYCIGTIGVVEEVFKLLPFLLILRRIKAFDEKIDGVIYASILALGFASFENLGYLTELRGFALVGRAFASPLTHAVFASIWGYWVGTATVLRRPVFPAAVRGIFIAALVHGLFDFLTVSPTRRVLSALLILGAWIWQLRLLERERAKKRAEDGPLPAPPAARS
jgi:RsiW-degrading membrane proteinase PrsW (M82 family)